MSQKRLGGLKLRSEAGSASQFLPQRKSSTARHSAGRLCFAAICVWLSGYVTPSAAETSASSPNGEISIQADVDPLGRPIYKVLFRGTEVIGPSRIGLRFANTPGLAEGMKIESFNRRTADTTWEQPWGERRFVRDHHNELFVRFISDKTPSHKLGVRFRIFDDGLGFRYEVPDAFADGPLSIVDELTEFRLPKGSTAWWIPGRNWRRYEYLYRTTDLTSIDRVHTPFTVRTQSGIHISIHEAALIDYAAMALDQRRPAVFKADLAPRSDGTLVKKEGAFTTPWRTIQISADAVGLLNSDLILNLNEPNALGDVSWVEPGKYIGIWWAMHIRDKTFWQRGGHHGATTAEAMRYIDFAAENGFSGVLVEGWNTGWDASRHEISTKINFTQPTSDFDIEAVAAYARSKGVRLIGHHETFGNLTNYEQQLHAALDFNARYGMRHTKTGYVSDGGSLRKTDSGGITRREWHDGQVAVNHHLMVLKEAAKRKISINPHEPVKDTGLRRTYPNAVTREGARGQEYNAWGTPPNPPEHTAILPFTRMLAGPMDFTPGIFDLMPNRKPPVSEELGRSDEDNRVQTTLAKQLALYVVIYGPIQMAADLPENYDARPGPFQFIKDVPTDWDQSMALAGEVGDFVVFVRKEKGGADWYLGALTDENERALKLPLTFLDDGMNYTAHIYRDGDNAHWDTSPYDIAIEKKAVSSTEMLNLILAPGGGAAIRFEHVEDR